MSSIMRTESDGGMTLARNSGIRTSTTGFPPANAPGALSGVRKSRAAAPVK